MSSDCPQPDAETLEYLELMSTENLRKENERLKRENQILRSINQGLHVLLSKVMEGGDDL